MPASITLPLAPQYVQKALTFNAQEWRQPWEDILNEGVVGGGDLAVTPGSGRTVNVATGVGWVIGDDTPVYQGIYRQLVDATVNVAIDANASGQPRIDLVHLRIYDAQLTGKIEVVNGTPGASPSPPALPSNAIPLGQVTVANGAASFTTGNIADVRTRAYQNPANSYLGSDLRVTQSATTDILTTTIVLAKSQRVRVGGMARFMADATSGGSGLAALAIAVDGTPESFAGPIHVSQTGVDPGQRQQLSIPTHSIEIAAGSHTIKLQADRDAGNVINASGLTTFNSRSYKPTALFIEF